MIIMSAFGSPVPKTVFVAVFFKGHPSKVSKAVRSASRFGAARAMLWLSTDNGDPVAGLLVGGAAGATAGGMVGEPLSGTWGGDVGGEGAVAGRAYQFTGTSPMASSAPASIDQRSASNGDRGSIDVVKILSLALEPSAFHVIVYQIMVV
jgi:hypothetical protein